MFLAGKPGQKQTLLAKKGKQMFLAGKKSEHYGCWLAKTAIK